MVTSDDRLGRLFITKNALKTINFAQKRFVLSIEK